MEDLIFELPADPTVKLTVTLAGGIVAVLDVKNFNVRINSCFKDNYI